MVKMKNLLNGNTWLWERGKFMNRRYLIQVSQDTVFCSLQHTSVSTPYINAPMAGELFVRHCDVEA